MPRGDTPIPTTPRGPQRFRIGDKVRKAAGLADRTATAVGTVFTITRVVTWNPNMWAYSGPTEGQLSRYESSAWEDELELAAADGTQVIGYDHNGRPLATTIQTGLAVPVRVGTDGQNGSRFYSTGIVTVDEDGSFVVTVRPDLWPEEHRPVDLPRPAENAGFEDPFSA